MSLAANGEAKYYVKPTGGRGQYGHVVLRLTVDEKVDGFTFDTASFHGVIPPEYIPAIDAGIRSVVDEGKLAERGYVGAHVELLDGSYHRVDSSDAAFFAAAVLAMEDALRQLPGTSIAGEEDSPRVREPRPPRRPNRSAVIAIPEPDDD